MRYLYTTKPDKHCHEVEDGVYGRPVHTSEEPKLLKSGWFVSIQKAKGNSDGLRKDEEEGREEEVEVDSDYDVWAAAYEQRFGRKPHHKMKTETIRQKLEESDE